MSADKDNNIKPFGRMSQDTAFNIAFSGYLCELDLLVRMVHSDYLMKLLPSLLDYPEFLSRGRRTLFGPHPLDLFCDNEGVISGTNEQPRTKELFACANLAACCHLFAGWTIPLGSLEGHQVGQYCQYAISQIGGGQFEQTRMMANRLNNGDAARVVQTLKILGLIDVNSSRYRQLSLGASAGARDREAIHQTPVIRAAVPGADGITAKTRWNELPPIAFGVLPAVVQDIVLVDINPNLKQHYEQLNAMENAGVLALNQDAYDALGHLAAMIGENRVMPRDLVVLFRMEPVMLPDIDRFVDLLDPVIAETADLVISIGAGDATEEFADRLAKMDEISASLSRRGMKPVRIKWCRGNTVEQQRDNPLFGLAAYASFEILYCKLRKPLCSG